MFNLTTEMQNHLDGVDMPLPKRQDYIILFVYQEGKILAEITMENYCTVVPELRHQLGIEVMEFYPQTTDLQELARLLGRIQVACELVENPLLKDHVAERRATIKKRVDDFKNEMFTYYGVIDHPKVELAYDLAWDRGHSAGYHEVVSEFDDIVELIL